MSIIRQAPAKINLMLHVVDRMTDGYHHLQSLVTFAEIGDEIIIEKANDSNLTVDGPFAEDVSFGPNNSIVQAAQWLSKKYPDIGQVHIHLTKNLPVSAGIGGGTSDAAATISGLLAYHKVSLSRLQEDALIVASGVLGADVPLCLAHQFGRGPLLWIDGSGRETVPISFHHNLPGVLLLVNPGVAISTSTIFQHICSPYTPAHDFEDVLAGDFQGNILAYLTAQTNDLMAPAIAQESVIRETLDFLQKAPGCLLTRMSGSGATCFALFEDEISALNARASFDKKMPQGWSACSL